MEKEPSPDESLNDVENLSSEDGDSEVFDYDAEFAKIEEKLSLMENDGNSLENGFVAHRLDIPSSPSTSAFQSEKQKQRALAAYRRSAFKYTNHLEKIKESRNEEESLRSTEVSRSCHQKSHNSHRKPRNSTSSRESRATKVCGVDDYQVLRKSAHHRRHSCSFTAGLDGQDDDDDRSVHQLSLSEVEVCHHKSEKREGKKQSVFSHKHKTKHRTVPCSYAALLSDTLKEHQAYKTKSRPRKRHTRYDSLDESSNAIVRLWNQLVNLHCC